jgi:hypothetical protein
MHVITLNTSAALADTAARVSEGRNASQRRQHMIISVVAICLPAIVLDVSVHRNPSMEVGRQRRIWSGKTLNGGSERVHLRYRTERAMHTRQ